MYPGLSGLLRSPLQGNEPPREKDQKQTCWSYRKDAFFKGDCCPSQCPEFTGMGMGINDAHS